jgi:hypothetical protein
MAKRLRCYLGLHSWKRVRGDDGQVSYKECRACGKFVDISDFTGGMLG